MILNNEERELFFQIITTKDVLDDIIEDYKEEEIRVPEVIFVTFKLDEDTINRLNIMGVKNVYHGMTREEAVSSQLAMLAITMDECQKVMDEEIRNLEIDIHNRLEHISDAIYTKINFLELEQYE